MELQIKKASEIKKSRPIKGIIYGASGIGKTTLACTASDSILLDIESGAHRSIIPENMPIADCFEAQTKEIFKLLSSGALDSAKTVVIDGLSLFGSKLVKELTPAGQEPTIKVWNRVSQGVDHLFLTLFNMKANIILICQEKKDEMTLEGTVFNSAYVPDLLTAFVKKFIPHMDFVGRVHQIAQNNKETRFLTTYTNSKLFYAKGNFNPLNCDADEVSLDAFFEEVRNKNA